MYTFIVCLLVGIAAAAKLDNTYLPPTNARTSGGNQDVLSTPLQQNTFGRASNYEAPLGTSTSHDSSVSSTFGGPERYQSPNQVDQNQRSSYNDADSIGVDASDYNERYQSPNPFSEDIGSSSNGNGHRGYQSGYQNTNEFQSSQLGRQYLPPTQQQLTYRY